MQIRIQCKKKSLEYYLSADPVTLIGGNGEKGDADFTIEDVLLVGP